MPKTDENVLVVRRALFDELGAFQGLRPDTDRYLAAFLKRENNFFLQRCRGPCRREGDRGLWFLALDELRSRRDNLESWSQIVLDAWESL